MGACWFWQSSCDIDWPAWVQAVGSVAAIAIAIALPRRDDAAKRRLIRQRGAAIAKLAVTHCARFNGIFHGVDFGPEDNPHVTFGRLYKLLDDFPLERLESTDAIVELVRFQGLLERYQERFEEAFERRPANGAVLEVDVGRADEAVRDLVNSADRLLKLI